MSSPVTLNTSRKDPAAASTKLQCQKTVRQRGDDSVESIDAMNVRDIANVEGPVNLRHGQLFRSSKFHSAQLRKALGVRCVMDLQKSGKDCSKWVHKRRMARHPKRLLHKLGAFLPGKLAPRCPVCEASLNANDEDYTVAVRISSLLPGGGARSSFVGMFGPCLRISKRAGPRVRMLAWQICASAQLPVCGQ